MFVARGRDQDPRREEAGRSETSARQATLSTQPPAAPLTLRLHLLGLLLFALLFVRWYRELFLPEQFLV